ncbi:MAG: ABC transporter permease [Pseudomonadota bacterium]
MTVEPTPALSHRPTPLVSAITMGATKLGAWLGRGIVAVSGCVRYVLAERDEPIVAGAVLAVLVGAALCAGLIAPYDTYDLAALSLLDASLPPSWLEDGSVAYLLGTDGQGRDLLSACLYGLRTSLIVAGIGVAIATVFGTAIGLISGFFGGWIDAVAMRLTDIQLTFPAILIALLVDGVLTGALGPGSRESFGQVVLIIAIATAFWAQFARTVRAATLVEREKTYVSAACLLGRSPAAIMAFHLVPNIAGPVVVLAVLNLAVAMLTEATLSFLGVGMPATHPSLGTLIRTGSDFLFSGEWWMSMIPGLALALLVLTLNLVGDWLRDRICVQR